jgi:hypothetical protein
MKKQIVKSMLGTSRLAQLAQALANGTDLPAPTPDRSAAARKAWVTRRRKAAARKAWATRRANASTI